MGSFVSKYWRRAQCTVFGHYWKLSIAEHKTHMIKEIDQWDDYQQRVTYSIEYCTRCEDTKKGVSKVKTIWDAGGPEGTSLDPWPMPDVIVGEDRLEYR